MSQLGLFEDYTVLVAHAVTAIVVGSRRSLTSKVVERLTARDAWQFPLIGSAILFGLYLVIKTLRKDLIDVLIAVYFAVIGAACIAHSIRGLIFPGESPVVRKFSILGGRIEFDVGDVATHTAGAAVAVAWIATKHWLANNAIGFTLAIEAITIVNIGSFSVGLILLCGLFVYDVFWVFGTDVMVSVVKGFNAPIKVAFPRSGILVPLLSGTAVSDERSVLGLGDIAIPGFVISHLIRFDEWRSSRRPPGTPPSRVFFAFGVCSYVAGLINTIAVMHFTKAAQPALLYLVPWILLTTLVVAACLGELKELFAFSSSPEKPAEEAEPKQKSQ